MRGRTNIGGGSGFSTGTVVTGIVKSGETISAGKFVELINSSTQTPIDLSYNDDKASNKRFIFKLSDGRFIVFYGYTTATTYARTQVNYKVVSVFTVGDDKPTINKSALINISDTSASGIWVDEITEDTFVVATLEFNSGWKIRVRKFVVDVTTTEFTETLIGSIDVSSIWTTSIFNSTYKSQRISNITICSVGDERNALLIYGNGYCNVVDVISGSIGSQTQITLTNLPVATSIVNSTSSQYWNENGDKNNYRTVNLKEGYILFRYRSDADVFVIINVNNGTVTKVKELNTGITGFLCYVEKISENKFAYIVSDTGTGYSTSCNLYLFSIANDYSLSYVTLIIPIAKLCDDTGFIDVVPEVYDSNTLYLLTLPNSASSKPACITKVDISDYNNPFALDYIIVQVLTGSTISTYDAFKIDYTTKKGFYLFSTASATSSSSGTWNEQPIKYAGIKIVNNAPLPLGDQLVFTKHVNNITGVSKTAGASGDEIQVYLPDVEE